jgi:hypothetical protein
MLFVHVEEATPNGTPCKVRRLASIEQHSFAFSLIVEGTTEKVLQFIIPLKSIYLGSIEQTIYF